MRGWAMKLKPSRIRFIQQSFEEKFKNKKHWKNAVQSGTGRLSFSVEILALCAITQLSLFLKQSIESELLQIASRTLRYLDLANNKRHVPWAERPTIIGWNEGL